MEGGRGEVGGKWEGGEEERGEGQHECCYISSAVPPRAQWAPTDNNAVHLLHTHITHIHTYLSGLHPFSLWHQSQLSSGK